MPARRPSSRQRFVEYRESLKQSPGSGNGKAGLPADGPATDKLRSGATRPALRLLLEFWRLLEGNRSAVIFSLATLSIATLLKLIPPAATKVTIDYVLTDRPIPPTFAGWIAL